MKLFHLNFLPIAFCFVLLAGCFCQVLRAIMWPKIKKGDFPGQIPFVSAILRGGASEVRGTPRAPKRFGKKWIAWHFTQNYCFRLRILKLASWYEFATGWNVPLLIGQNNSYRIGDDYWSRSFYCSKKLEAKDTELIEKLMCMLEQSEIPVLYVIPPSRFGEGDEIWNGVFDFSNYVWDRQKAVLSAKNHDVFDLRPIANNKFKKARYAYFMTDHHLTPDAALGVARAIAKRMNEQYHLGLDEEALLPEKFSARIYHHAFIGSIGKKAVVPFLKLDDFPLMGTAEKGDFEIYIPKRKIRRRGGSKALVDMRYIRSNPSYRGNMYASYLFADQAIVHLRNFKRNDGLSILIISDSFDNAMASFMINSLERVTSVDLRHLREKFPEWLKKQDHYDAVVIFWNRPPPQLAWHLSE